MQHLPTYGCSSNEAGPTQQQPCSSSQILQNWHETGQFQLTSGLYDPNLQVSSHQLGQAPDLNTGSTMDWNHQNSLHPTSPEDQMHSWNSEQVAPQGIPDNEQQLNDTKGLLNSSPSFIVPIRSLVHENILTSRFRTDLQEILSPDGSLHSYFLAQFAESSYVFPYHCNAIAKIIVNTVVKPHGINVPWQYMEELAKELVRLAPFLGDPDDPDRGYKLWFDFRPTEKGLSNGYLRNKLRYLMENASDHSRIEKVHSGWESEEEDESVSIALPARLQQLERRDAVTRRQIVRVQEFGQAVESIRKMFPSFFLMAGRIPQDFYIRFPRLEGRLRRNWPRIAVSLCELDLHTQILKRAGIQPPFLTMDEGRKHLAAAVLLSLLLREVPWNQQAAAGSSTLGDSARKGATSIIRFLPPLAMAHWIMLPHPHIVIEGDLASLEASRITVSIAENLVPCRDVPEALETLFTAHFVLNIPFPPVTRLFLKFIQHGLYERVTKSTDKLATSLRQLLSQVRGPPRAGISFQQYDLRA